MLSKCHFKGWDKMLTPAWFSHFLRVGVYLWSSFGYGSVQRDRERQDRFIFFYLLHLHHTFKKSIFENSLQLIDKTGLNSSCNTCVS